MTSARSPLCRHQQLLGDCVFSPLLFASVWDGGGQLGFPGSSEAIGSTGPVWSGLALLQEVIGAFPDTAYSSPSFSLSAQINV